MLKKRNLIGFSLVALIVGGFAGWFGHGLTVEPEVEVVAAEKQVVKEDPTDEELKALCSDLTEAQKKDVLQVQETVKTLQSTLAEKEEELAELRSATKKKSKKSGKKISKASQEELQKMEAEVATMRVQLAAATHERDALKKELKSTLKKLDFQIKETKKYKKKARKYKRQSVDNLWRAFVAESKKAACVTRGITQASAQKKHDECSAAFGAVFTSKIRERFKTCAHSQAGMPIFKKKGWFEKMPPFSAVLDPKGKNKYTKGYYIIFCDPTLPEKADSDLELLKESAPISKPDGIEEEENDLNFDLEDKPSRKQKKRSALDDLDLDD